MPQKANEIMANENTPDATATSASTSEAANDALGHPPESRRIAVTKIPSDIEAALAMLHTILGWNAIDARIRLRQAPTIWPEELTAEMAARFVVEFRALGGEATVIPVQAVHELRHPRVLRHIRCEADGLKIYSLEGTVERIVPWPDVALLSIAEIAHEGARFGGRLPDGVFRHDPGITAPMPRQEKLGFELWMVLRSPIEAVRLESESLNYEYLGSRLASSSYENFITLACDLVGHARQAVLTPWTRTFLNDPAHPSHALHTTSAHHDALLAHWSAIEIAHQAIVKQK
jgi:hypothetical protein